MSRESRQVRPIFVVGAARSGTTLTVNLLGLHSWLEPVYETGFVVNLLAILRVFSLLAQDRRVPRLVDYRMVLQEWAQQLPELDPAVSMPKLPYGKVHLWFSPEELVGAMDALIDEIQEDASREHYIGALRGFVESLFDLQAERAGKRGWVNKTPAYIEYLGELTTIFPDALLVNVVRDTRDAACSLLQEGWDEASLEEAALRTARQQQAGLLFASRHSVTEVRFEDLVTRPAKALADLSERLGLPDESSRIIATFERLGSVFDSSGAHRWRIDLSASELLRLEAVLRPTLDCLGYQLPTEPELEAMRARPPRFSHVPDPLATVKYKAKLYDRVKTELDVLRSAEQQSDASGGSGR